MKRAQTHFFSDSVDDENSQQILAEWLQTTEQLACGYRQVELLVTAGQSPTSGLTQSIAIPLSPQVVVELEQLQRDAYHLLAGLNNHISTPDGCSSGPFTIRQLREHTALLKEWNQRLQAILCLLRPFDFTDRYDHN